MEDALSAGHWVQNSELDRGDQGGLDGCFDPGSTILKVFFAFETLPTLTNGREKVVNGVGGDR